MNGRSNLEDVAVELVHETDKAYLVTDGRIVGGKRIEVWVAKSLTEFDKGILTAPEWLLKDKGLI
jgi:hypothetical protein